MEKVEYSAIVGSDHAPILIDLLFYHYYSSRPQWQFNTTLLSDNTFCTSISIAINIFLEANKMDYVSLLLLLWETLKAYLMAEIIAYSSHCNRQRKRQKQQLIDAISELDHFTKREYHYKLAISTSETEQFILRSQGLHYEHGEKSQCLLAHQLILSQHYRLYHKLKMQRGKSQQTP